MKILCFRWLAAAILMTALTSQTANAVARHPRLYDGVTVADMVAMLEASSAGITIVSQQNASGEEFIEARFGQNGTFGVTLFDCRKEDRLCETIVFASSFTPPSQDQGLVASNNFNKSTLNGRGYLSDDGVVWIEYSADVSKGVTEAHLLEVILVWIATLREFGNTDWPAAEE